ncbi:FtsB family cell division protein [Kineosporia babensis]|uniref:FtsB family cell division protein n=1 Tax=Kineosporia babensis TaxID=499548 RepID=UPI0022B06F46|nr:septum formation initiator family protein [Kineosporia babensis]
MSPRRPPAPGSGGSSDPSGTPRASRARGDGTKAAGKAPYKKAAPKKAAAQSQPLKKTAPKKTAAAKKAPRRPEGVSAQERAAASAAAKKKRAAAKQRARTMAAGSPISRSPHKNRTRTTASRSGGLRSTSTRPGSARPRAAAAGRGTRKRGFGVGSGRPVWVLGAVGVMLALLILPYFEKWLGQRSELEATRAEVAQATQDVAELEKQQERWKDDEYVRAQARARLGYVMPGETGYRVTDPGTDSETPETGTQETVPTGNRSWFSSIWLSAEAAGAAGEAQATTVVP